MYFIWNSLTFLIWLKFMELCLFKIKETDINFSYWNNNSILDLK